MKEVIKKNNIYEFKELDKNIQEKLIEKEQQQIIEDYCTYCLYEDLEEKAKELLKKNFKNAELKKIYYDFNYCQGNGVCLEFDLVYYNKDISIKQEGRYTHERSFTIWGDITEKQEDKLTEKIININRELKKYGYNLIENAATREEVILNLEKFNYLKNGNIFTD